MRPSENGGFQPNVVMNDQELAQVTFAMRIFDHDVDISYSTRESAEFRNHMATLGVTTMSAESKTEPEATLPIRRHWSSFMSATNGKPWKWMPHCVHWGGYPFTKTGTRH